MKNIGSYPSVRLRRNRRTNWSRRLVRENDISANDLILPIFVTDGKRQKKQISSMPGVYRYSVDKLGEVVERAAKLKIPLLALFPHTANNKKNIKGTEALNENNLVCKALRFIKKNFKKDIGLMCDVALDPYTSHGHDGILKNNYVQNDQTVEILVKQSLLLAQMGCDVIAPSDMMDGRIGKIRKALDKQNFEIAGKRIRWLFLLIEAHEPFDILMHRYFDETKNERKKERNEERKQERTTQRRKEIEKQKLLA